MSFSALRASVAPASRRAVVVAEAAAVAHAVNVVAMTIIDGDPAGPL